MRKAIVFLLLIYLLISTACRTTEYPGPSIVGAWVFTTMSGAIVSNNSGQFDTTTMYFDTTTKTLIQATHQILLSSPQSSYSDTIIYRLSSEVWTFGADGTYSILESYWQTQNKYTKQIEINDGGVWEYENNTKNHSAFVLHGGISNLFTPSDDHFYSIQTVNDSVLILTFVSERTGNQNYVDNTTLSYTFTKK